MLWSIVFISTGLMHTHLSKKQVYIHHLIYTVIWSYRCYYYCYFIPKIEVDNWSNIILDKDGWGGTCSFVLRSYFCYVQSLKHLSEVPVLEAWSSAGRSSQWEAITEGSDLIIDLIHWQICKCTVLLGHATQWWEVGHVGFSGKMHRVPIPFPSLLLVFPAFIGFLYCKLITLLLCIISGMKKQS